MEEKKLSCLCGSSSQKQLVLACSGASDLGELSDAIARKLKADGIRSMNCLAKVSAGYKDTIDSVRQNDTLVIDGCGLDCGKKILEQQQITDFTHIRLTDLGFKKGSTTVNDASIASAIEQIS